MRLDKFLANMGVGTRSEVKACIRQGRVTINGERAKKPEQKVSEDTDCVCVDGQEIHFTEMQYLMLNKPQGVVTATEDREHKTVLDLIDSPMKKQLFRLAQRQAR